MSILLIKFFIFFFNYCCWDNLATSDIVKIPRTQCGLGSETQRWEGGQTNASHVPDLTQCAIFLHDFPIQGTVRPTHSIPFGHSS